MKKGWIVCAALLTLASFMMAPTADARHKAPAGPDKIIFIPHDNRPISDKQTAAAVDKLVALANI